ncbi:hypothetical protein ABPG74_019206 [Tetrahymena malaccensis]
MNKFLILIPVLCLVGAGLLLVESNKTSLSVDNDNVTFSQYYICMNEHVYHRDSCTDTDNYQQTKEKLFQYQSTNPACIAYNNYADKVLDLNDFDTAMLNKDQLYQNCRANPEFLAIVKQDYNCFYTQFIAPELKFCSGLNL